MHLRMLVTVLEIELGCVLTISTLSVVDVGLIFPFIYVCEDILIQEASRMRGETVQASVLPAASVLNQP